MKERTRILHSGYIPSPELRLELPRRSNNLWHKEGYYSNPGAAVLYTKEIVLF